MTISHYKGLLFDVDKTLTNSHREITQVTKDSLKLLSQKGYEVAVCTGRQFVTLRSTLSDMFPEKSLHICAGGAQIITTGGKVLYEKNITEDVAKMVVKLADAYGCRAVLQQGDILYGNEKALQHVSTSTLAGAHTITKRPIEAIENWSIPIIVVVGTTPEIVQELSALPINIKKMVNYVGEEYVDITAQGVSKASGIKEWSRLVGITATEIIGFGDSENDIEFLQTVGYGVAMGNAIDELKKLSDEVTEDCDHDGVAHWIERNI